MTLGPCMTLRHRDPLASGTQDSRLDPRVRAPRPRGIEVAQLVNELLKKDIELIEAAR